MKGIFFEEKQKVSVRDIPRPECLPGSMIVRVEAAGICGSDLHAWFGHWLLPDKVVGHEMSGVVEEIGDGVEGFAVGDRVCTECFRHCGVCENCRTGLYNLCTNRSYLPEGVLTGAFAEYARVAPSSTFKMPEGATARQTVTVEPVAVAWRAAAQANPKPGDLAVVIGGGTIGLLTAAVLKTCYRLRCMISVKYDTQAAIAAGFGIDTVHRAGSGKLSDAAKEAGGGRMADVAVDTIGSTAAVADAVDALRPAGTLCLVALPGGRTIMPMGTIVVNELRLVGSSCYGYSYGRRDFDSAIDLVASGALPAEKIITHEFPMARAQEAFTTAADKNTGSVKVMIT